MDIKKAQGGLIDKLGRRKYFAALNPTLLEKPITIDVKSIKKKKKILFLMPNFHWIDEDVNALWDLVPWNLCQIASVIEDISADIKNENLLFFVLNTHSLQNVLCNLFL